MRVRLTLSGGRAATGLSGRVTARMDRVTLYRDEAIVLRTHKLGEADRIVTLLTRRTGRCVRWPRGCADASRFGSRLEPFMHVDVQLARAATSTSSRRPRRSARSPARLCEDYTATRPAP